MIGSARLTALYLFDVSESIRLERLKELLQASAQPARLPLKPAMPSYVRYQSPPLQIDGESIGLGNLEGFDVRVKVFDYGVVSLSLTRPFSGAWDELIATATRLTGEHALEAGAERLCREFVERIRLALHEPRERFLSEDYFVFSVTAFNRPLSADALVAEHGHEIARLLRAEPQALSVQERDDVLRHRLSYLANDLVVPTWSTALVYDTESSVQGALEIFEYANSQLLQFRYYDNLLNGRLASLYRELETRQTYNRWWPRRYTRAAREVHALFIDVNELTDRTENALKLVGDVYAARLLALAHSRLGVTAWRESIEDKLETLDEIYRFAVDQTAMARGELLEIAIVAILVFELALFFMGIMK